MFGGYVGGEIIFASIPKDISGPGGGNQPISITPGRSTEADGSTDIQTTSGSFSMESSGGDFSMESSGGETYG